VAYRVLAIDDPLQANPRGVKLWEWESRALGLEHFAEFVRVEIARAEGRTTNFVSAKSYYNAAVLTRSALGIHVRLTPHSTKNTTPAAGEIKHGRTDQRFSKLPWAASVPTTEKPQERSEKAGASHKAQPFDILSDVGPAYACFGNSEDLETQPAARHQEPRPDSPGDPVALNRKLELAIKRKARPGDPEKTSSKISRKSPSPPLLEPNTSPDVEEVLETVDLESPAKKQENTPPIRWRHRRPIQLRIIHFRRPPTQILRHVWRRQQYQRVRGPPAVAQGDPADPRRWPPPLRPRRVSSPVRRILGETAVALG
jgi:hypothetical protein